jgi:uncharacterized membrane protein YcaP (DUF421 family)
MEAFDFTRIWGTGEALEPLQMAARAGVMFFVLLALVRVGGVRIFGRKAPTDAVVAVLLGAIAARGIVGASPFGSTVAAGAVLVVLHRLVAVMFVRFPALARLAAGRRVCLYRDGRIQLANLMRTSISEADLMESLRLETRQDDLSMVREASMEPNGRISFVLRASEPAVIGSGTLSRS